MQKIETVISACANNKLFLTDSWAPAAPQVCRHDMLRANWPHVARYTSVLCAVTKAQTIEWKRRGDSKDELDL